MAQNFVGGDDFLSPYEAECLIRNIQEIDLRDYGSKKYDINKKPNVFRWIA